MINSLPGECPNKGRGCTSKLTRGIVKEHVHNSCDFADVECPNQCGLRVFKKDLSVHQNDVCLKRLAPCNQCAIMVTVDAMLEHLQNSCLKSQVLCADCNESLVREHLRFHQQRECTKITLKCPFAQFGCQFTGLRSQFNQHLIEDSDLHVGAVIEREERMRNEITKLKEELARLKGGQKDKNKFSFDDIEPKKHEFEFKVPDVPKPANNSPWQFNIPEAQPNVIGFQFGPQKPKAPQPNFAFNAPNNFQPNAPKQPFAFHFNPPVVNNNNNSANTFSFNN